jgi:enoyl-CoA hydratase
MPFITAARQGSVTVVSVDRPPANAMNLALLGELVAMLQRLHEELPAAVVLTGREGCFSAGVDLKEAPGYDAAQQRRMVELINQLALLAYGLPCPLVCAISGHAIAGGLVLAVCGDHRVASTAGRYGLAEVKVGVPFPQAALGVVRAELTAPAARVLALGSRLVDAEACVRLGAFDEALPPGGVLARALEVADELAHLPGAVYARTKAGLRGAALAELRRAADADPLLAGWLPAGADAAPGRAR